MKHSNYKICIVVPTYKENLSINEKISLEQCKKVLGKYDIFFLKPEGMDIGYLNGEKIIEIKEEYLTSRKKYSDYVLSLEFYDLFQMYDYMLIYQLDAFVFEDCLMEFCNYEYDYIGAPWPYGMECHVHNSALWYVGNGGLSLRNIAAFRRWISYKTEEVNYAKMLLPEDMAIATYGRNDIRIASPEVALRFAFDLNPEDCFRLNDNKLPFGCHGWHKFGSQFWQPIFESYGYEILLNSEESAETKLLMDGKNRRELFCKYYNKKLFNKCLQEILENYDGIISVFGAGQYGLSFINMIKGSAIKIDVIYDNDNDKIGKMVEGISIKSSADIIKRDNLAILIAMMNPEPIAEQLENMGYMHGRDFAFSKELQYKMIENGSGD